MARGNIVRRLISSFRGSLNPGTSNLATAKPEQPGPLSQRYAPCRILEQSGIPNVVWFEDVLALYGSDTAVFDLYLLVSDGCAAAVVLQKSGYSDAPIANTSHDDERACRGRIRLEGPDGQSNTGTVLVNSSEWNYNVNRRAEYDLAPLPPLNKFLDAVMTYWLDIPEAEYTEKYVWALSIATLIGYAYNLPNPNHDLMRSPDFAAQLQPEVRELHYDLAGTYPKKAGISSFRKHEYHSLRCKQIRDGEFTPRPYPADHFPVSMAEYPELTGMNVDTVGHISRKKGKKKRQSRKVEPLESIDEDAG